MLAVRRDHPLAGRSEVSLEEVSTISLALPDVDFGVRRIIDSVTGAKGVRLEPILSTNDFEVLRSFVRWGAGGALLPMRAIVRRAEDRDLVAVPLTEARFNSATIDLIVLRKRRLPRVLQVFVEALGNEIASTAIPEDFATRAAAAPPSSPQ